MSHVLQLPFESKDYVLLAIAGVAKTNSHRKSYFGSQLTEIDYVEHQEKLTSTNYLAIQAVKRTIFPMP